MNRVVFGAAFAALFWCGSAQARCIIVTNGTLEIYDHEIAHCNGWSHAPYAEGVQPPLSLVYDYPGELIVILARGWFIDPGLTLMHAQTGAKIVQSKWRVPEICRSLWRKRSIQFDAAKTTRIVGCSVRD